MHNLKNCTLTVLCLLMLLHTGNIGTKNCQHDIMLPTYIFSKRPIGPLDRFVSHGHGTTY